MSPERIHRSRRKGYKMPPNCVSITRPGRFGNPFSVNHLDDDRAIPYWAVIKLDGPTHKVLRRVHSRMEALAFAIRAFRLYALIRLHREPGWLDPLRGKNLACFCAIGALCHGDVLLELANR